MKTTKRLAAVCTAAALTILSATSATADDLDNGLDTGIDVQHELINLQYDDADHIAGPNGTTTLSVFVEDKGEGGDTFNNCNLPGNHSVTIVPTYDTTVVTVALSGGGIIDDCGDTILVTVTPEQSGTTAVTFAGVNNTNDHAPFDLMDYSGGDFDVVVTDTDLGDGGSDGGSVCDADPAAPAWAAALLKGNAVKAKGTTWSNYVSSVAKQMGQRATFDGEEKFDHPGYENAVWQYMTTELGLTLPKGPHHADVIKPGWECTAVPGSTS